MTQQEEFQDMIPRVEYVLDNCEDILSGQEERWLYEYLQYINNRRATCPNTVIYEATSLVEYLSRV